MFDVLPDVLPDVRARSVLSGYGRDSLDNELDMELDDDAEELDGFTEDRLDFFFFG